MQQTSTYYTDLLSGFIDSHLSAEQAEELLAFIEREPEQYRTLLDSPVIRQQLLDRAGNGNILVSDVVSERMLNRLLPVLSGAKVNEGAALSDGMTRDGIRSSGRVHRMRRYWLAASAAAVILVIVAGFYLWKKDAGPGVTTLTTVQANIPPGGNKATLTLAGGRVITLDSAANGLLVQQGATTIVKLAGGQIVYEQKEGSTTARTGASSEPAEWNTMATPRGGQYQLTLPDGTRVWLNAASSITYPTAFTGEERKVLINGEAYFEVAQDKQQPFLVETGTNSAIEVLGTRFNVNAYADEPAVRTTLLDGSVKVKGGTQAALLRPGQQASIASRPTTSTQAGNNVQLTITDHADISQVMAWKNGSFRFDRTSVDVVMRQLSRWYDVDVVYEKGIPAVRFGGEMKRDLSLSEVLAILNKMEVHCRIDGKKLIVLP
jgi:transmembrane sensor